MLRAILFTLFLLTVSDLSAAVRYAAVAVSDSGIANSLSEPHTSRNVATDPDGTIFVVYHGSTGIRVAVSRDDGASFEPSVQVSASNREAEIAVSSDGTVYVAWTEGGSLMLARSTDSGLNFDGPRAVAACSDASVHLAVDGDRIYAVGRSTDLIYRSTDGGGTFATTALTLGNYSDVLVDPWTHDVYVQTESPQIRYYVSTDSAQTFSAAIVPSPSRDITYGVSTGLFGAVEKRFAVAGGIAQGIAGSESRAYVIDTTTQTLESLTFGSNTAEETRTLASTTHGYLADGYSNGGNVYYALSQDAGTSFAAPVQVAASAANMSLSISRGNYDVIAVYEKEGQIYCSVYDDSIPAPQVLPGDSEPGGGGAGGGAVIGVPLFDGLARVLLLLALLLPGLWMLRARSA